MLKPAQPCFDLIVGHHVVCGEHGFLYKENDSPMESGATFKQVFAQSPDSQTGMQVRASEAVSQSLQCCRNLLAVSGTEFRHPFPQVRMDIDSHSLPVNGFVWPAARACRTAVFTALYARSACFSPTPYSCRT